VAVTYAIVGWLLVQIATQVFPFLEIPTGIVRLVIVLVAAGFPIALVIAWAFELTPGGIEAHGRCQSCDRETEEISRLDLRGCGWSGDLNRVIPTRSLYSYEYCRCDPRFQKLCEEKQH
jgi:hypothetical protein